MKLRKMEALKCPNCGASVFKPIRHDGLTGTFMHFDDKNLSFIIKLTEVYAYGRI